MEQASFIVLDVGHLAPALPANHVVAGSDHVGYSLDSNIRFVIEIYVIPSMGLGLCFYPIFLPETQYMQPNLLNVVAGTDFSVLKAAKECKCFAKSNLTVRNIQRLAGKKGFKVTTKMQSAWLQMPGYSTKESFSQTLDYTSHCYVLLWLGM